jgi:hypothetical protein
MGASAEGCLKIVCTPFLGDHRNSTTPRAALEVQDNSRSPEPDLDGAVTSLPSTRCRLSPESPLTVQSAWRSIATMSVCNPVHAAATSPRASKPWCKLRVDTSRCTDASCSTPPEGPVQVGAELAVKASSLFKAPPPTPAQPCHRCNSQTIGVPHPHRK